MEADLDHESWLIERGAEVIEKKAVEGVAALTPHERLIYCLWVADYGMRNAGDLDTAADLYDRFQDDGRDAAANAGLPTTHSAFSLARSEFEKRYFELFDPVCNEVRRASA